MNIPLHYQEYPFFQASPKQDLILFLIKKELQGTRFTNQLAALGFDTALYTPDLGKVILALLGSRQQSDELWTWYYTALDEEVKRIDLQDMETVQEATMRFYGILKNKLEIEN